MWRLDLGNYLAAAEILEVSEERLARLPRLELAESTLAAPFAGQCNRADWHRERKPYGLVRAAPTGLLLLVRGSDAEGVFVAHPVGPRFSRGPRPDVGRSERASPARSGPNA